jgi:acetyl-CoA carboxylase biotin carboxyl carrier protein
LKELNKQNTPMANQTEKQYSEILGLIEAIAASGLDEVFVENGYKIKVRRNSEVQVQTIAAPVAAAPAPVYAPAPAPVAAAPMAAPAPVADAPAAPAAPKANEIIIRSSMVGTFYRSASPNDPNYVSVGDTITKGQVIGLIEAMKLFNEIESDFSGKIVKILVENAAPVEFDQPLLVLEA